MQATTMSEQDSLEGLSPEEARRAKLERIAAMGLDPWGQRFDDRASIQSVRERIGEARLKLESGEELELPDLEADPEFDFKAWMQEKGKAQMSGPMVRVAGRIMSNRDTGKLMFIDLEDQTASVQLFVGKNQVGEENWKLAQNFDLGDIIGVDGQLRRTKTGEITIFVKDLTFLTKALDPPPEKFHGLTDPEMRQRMALHRHGLQRRRSRPFHQSDKDRAVDSRDAQQQGFLRGRRSDVTHDCWWCSGSSV